jgi:Ca2+-binding EF-hand superfamily protein
MRHTLLFLLVPVLPAIAEDEPLPRPALMQRDADGDGRLSPAEFGPDRELFDLLDRDGDGFLAAQELPKPRKPKGEAKAEDTGERARKQAEKFLKANDKDGDGKIGMSEWSISSRPLADADGNGDQVVDMEELTRFFAKGKPRGDGKPRGPGDAPGGPGMPPGPEAPVGPAEGPERPHIREMAEGLMQRLDKDGDGRISGEEMPKGGRPDLSKADRNGDGGVDVIELTLVITERAGRGGGPGPMAERLKQMDGNGDGVIEKAEWKGPPERFDALDADRDGKLTEAEAKQALGAMGEGRWMDKNADAAFRRFDADEDGRITAEEWKARPETFQLLDANRDGAITRDELTPKGPARGRGGNRPDVRSGRDSAHFLEKYDGNRDGQVTREEFPHDRRFAEIDADGNGVLSKAEIEDSMDRVRNEEGYGIFERYDLDGDGRITREEFTGPAADFERLDRNRDGVLDRSDGAEEKPEAAK